MNVIGWHHSRFFLCVSLVDCVTTWQPLDLCAQQYFAAIITTIRHHSTDYWSFPSIIKCHDYLLHFCVMNVCYMFDNILQ
jgi:hypothetical protein